jgi:hypothetical protein
VGVVAEELAGVRRRRSDLHRGAASAISAPLGDRAANRASTDFHTNGPRTRA